VPGKSMSLWNNVMIWRVAAMLFLGLSVYLFTANSIPNKPSRETAKLQGEFSDLESFYSEQIAQKVELIHTIQNFNDGEAFTQGSREVGGDVFCFERADENQSYREGEGCVDFKLVDSNGFAESTNRKFGRF
jgi:hypothetical protein